MQMARTLSNSAAPIAPAIVKRLGGRRVLFGVLALALIGAGLAWQWSWLVAIGVGPLLISAAPCVAMCALGLCMHRICNHGGGTASNGTSQNSSPQQET
ncbi:hypothetical protein HYPDE_27173 [Hyphomicrobium denitrificans 1NES1]|uniref:Transmembrane protein n=1 Tax=Hyphomicrobium denitrificans 1NES1 TaxID=670307 RepID=N0B0X8_9HYPH|nr:hypothetical protein [Hyphomicrobium denitrificans]AGK57114.1 hypothetical protein HYPDE_27173 [Hyphomicrobium denitrificans 1NES1]